MKLQDIAFLGCRFFALYILFHGLFYVFNFGAAPFFFQESSKISQLTLIIFAFSFLAFLFFWFKAEWLAARIAGNRADADAQSAMSIVDLQTAGFAIIGMWFIADTIPAIANSVMIVVQNMDPFSPQMLGYYVQQGVQLLLGIGLLLGAGGISNTISKLRK